MMPQAWQTGASTTSSALGLVVNVIHRKRIAVPLAQMARQMLGAAQELARALNRLAGSGDQFGVEGRDHERANWTRSVGHRSSSRAQETSLE